VLTPVDTRRCGRYGGGVEAGKLDANSHFSLRTGAAIRTAGLGTQGQSHPSIFTSFDSATLQEGKGTMRKVAVTVFALMVLISGLSSRSVAEEVPDGVLTQMGLSGMQRISDERGMQVRGEGFATTFGLGVAATIFPQMKIKPNFFFDAAGSTNALAHGQSSSSVSASASFFFIRISTSASGSSYGQAYGR